MRGRDRPVAPASLHGQDDAGVLGAEGALDRRNPHRGDPRHGDRDSRAMNAAASLLESPSIAGIPLEFLLFAATLAGVALFHHHTLRVALTGLAAITGYKLAFTGFKEGAGIGGLVAHLQHEGVI